MSAVAGPVRSHEATSGRPARRAAAPVASPKLSRLARDPASVLRLQRAAGNRATVAALNLSRCGAGCGCANCTSAREDEFELGPKR